MLLDYDYEGKPIIALQQLVPAQVPSGSQPNSNPGLTATESSATFVTETPVIPTTTNTVEPTFTTVAVGASSGIPLEASAAAALGWAG